MRKELETFKDLKIEQELCEKLDEDVYLPVKEELKDFKKTYSLGMRKEDFKGLISEEMQRLRHLAINWVIEDLKNSIYLWREQNKNKSPYNKLSKSWRKLPDGKCCFCSEDASCEFHREGRRLMFFFDLTDKKILQTFEREKKQIAEVI